MNTPVVCQVCQISSPLDATSSSQSRAQALRAQRVHQGTMVL